MPVKTQDDAKYLIKKFKLNTIFSGKKDINKLISYIDDDELIYFISILGKTNIFNEKLAHEEDYGFLKFLSNKRFLVISYIEDNTFEIPFNDIISIDPPDPKYATVTFYTKELTVQMDFSTHSHQLARDVMAHIIENNPNNGQNNPQAHDDLIKTGQAKTTKCPECAATVIIMQNQAAKCEYCDTYTKLQSNLVLHK